MTIQKTEKRYKIFMKKKYPLSKYLNVILVIFIYVTLSIFLRQLGEDNSIVKVLSFNIEASVFRGIIIQLQLLLGIYLVVKENKMGYIISMTLNTYSIIAAIIFIVFTSSPVSLPGVISYLGAIFIITLLRYYKAHTDNYIEQINHQKKTLEESENKLQRMAFYDSLTQMPNKDLFISLLEQSIHNAKRNGSLIGVMFIDLDSFKAVNDTMGHSAGDMVLKQIAERLRQSLRKEDTVSRFGGDEFLIQVANIERVEDLYKISNKIMEIFQKPVVVNNVEFVITSSVGVAVYPVDGENTESLIKNADIAMYSAKNKGKNQCIYCSPEMKNDIIKKMKLTNALYRALDRKELFMQYQPQIKTDTQEIIGFESLIRWKNPEYGLVSPDVFIPLAEKTGMIKPIGLWIFRTVCEQCKQCSESLSKQYRLSVNLSLEQLKDANFINQVMTILQDTKTDPKHIQVEITETTAFNKEPYVLQRIQELKNLGMTISIDDFGTGHSSLSRLRTFPIDLIKIDMEFVRGISTNSHKEKEIIKSIIQLAKNLGIEVLAEGVETKEQYLFLKNEKCDEIQGFYFYKPMMPDDIKALLCADINLLDV